MNGKRVLKVTVAIVIGALVIYFIVRTLRENAGQLREYRFTFHYGMLVLSYAAMVVSGLFLPWAWRNICRFFHVQLSYTASLQVLFLSYITRLVPGRVLTLLSQIAAAREQAVPPHVSAATAVIYQLFGTIVGVQVFLVSVLLWPDVGGGVKLLSGVLALLLFLLSLWARVLEVLVAAAMRLIKRPAATFHLRAADAAALQLILWVSWLLFALAVHLLLNSFGSFTPAQSGTVTGIQAASALIGYYTFLSPGGLGVREGAQIAMLGRHVLPVFTVIIPLVLRVWMTVGDILLFIIGVFVRGRARR